MKVLLGDNGYVVGVYVGDDSPNGYVDVETRDDELFNLGMHKVVDGRVVFTIPDKVALQNAKTDKLERINAEAGWYVAHMAKTFEVPEFEKDTWVLQAKETKAWKADPSTPTPLMDTIAKQRGVPREALLEKAYIKAVRFELLTASVAGQRQKYADMINNAKSLEDLDFEVKYEV